MSQIRVARIITRLNVGGPAYQAVLLNHLLPSRGYDSLLIHGQVPQGEAFFDRLPAEYPGAFHQVRHLARRIDPVADSAALVEMVRVLRAFKPDIIHTHTAKAGLIGRLAGKIIGTKIMVHTFHGHVLEGYFSRLTEKMIVRTERTLARWTDQLITVSPRLTKELSEIYGLAPLEKFSTIELGLPLEPFHRMPEQGVWRQKLGVPDDALVLGSLGRLTPIKNHDRMIRVFGALVKIYSDRDLHLIIGGTGPLETELKETAKKIGVSERVHFPGLVEDLPRFYADIDIAILTSDNEGTPVTLIEAQAAGKFCVAPEVGGVADILTERSGTLVKPNRVEAYVEALTKIIPRLEELTVQAQEERLTVIERFSPERLVERIDSLYKNLINRQGNSYNR